MTRSGWFYHPQPNPRAVLRLVCFHHAGVGASAFRLWPRHLPPGIELSALQLPGREGRLREPAFQSLEAGLPAVVEALRDCHDRRLVIYGHSMGALYAFESARALEAAGTPPDALVLSGRRAPHVPPPRPPIAGLDEGAFVEAVRARYGGIPAQILAEPELLNLLLPTLRADLRVVEGYAWTPGHTLTCPLLVCGGADDAEAPPAALDAWAGYTRGAFERRTFPGGHFFWQADLAAFLGELGAALMRWDVLPSA